MVVDPLTALGLAANIIQFIDFASNAVVSGYRLYSSVNRALGGGSDIEKLTHDLLQLTTALKKPLPAGVNDELSDSERSLESLRLGCQDVAQELLKRLQRLKVEGKRGKWKDFQKFMRGTWEARQIASVQERLESYRNELQLRILVTLREEIDIQDVRRSEQFDALDDSARAVLESLLESHDSLIARIRDGTERMTELHSQSRITMVEQHHKTRADITAEVQKLGDRVTASFVASRQRCTPDLDVDAHPTSTTLAYANQAKIKLESVQNALHFVTMEDRHADIPKAHKATFNWIYSDSRKRMGPWDSFGDWLRNGNGIYWINGKAGSGKSTLMKYVYNDSRTWDRLCEWSGDCSLLHAGFFFWNSGTELQKTHQGMLQSVLYSILSQSPDLLHLTFPDTYTEEILRQMHSGNFKWTRAQLETAFRNLVSQTQLPIKIFLLIDGLDELDGDHDEIAEIFKDIESQSVKIALSSRPLNVFGDAFQMMPKLRLQDLTEQDIKAYVNATLCKNPRMLRMVQEERMLRRLLVEEIVQKASGVFLWVSLVVKSLLDGLRNDDCISDLRRRLESLPPDLESLYKHMLQTVNSFYHPQCSRYLALMKAVREPPLTLKFALAVQSDRNPSYALEAPIDIMNRAKAFELCDDIERSIKASCAGLLEVDYSICRRSIKLLRGRRLQKQLTLNDYKLKRIGSRVQYLHRTVSDYLQRPGVLADILPISCTADFKASLSLFRGYLLHLKMLPLKAPPSDDEYSSASLSRIIHDAMLYAKISEDETRQPQIALLEEFNRVTRQIQRTSRRSESKEAYTSACDLSWLYLNPGIGDHKSYYVPHDNTSTIYMAVAFGLVLSVSALLERDETGIFQKQSGMLLLYAMGDDDFWTLDGLKVTKLLLERGAQPNDQYDENGQTPWLSFLRRCEIYITTEVLLKDTLKLWLQVLLTFLRNGVDLDAEVLCLQGKVSVNIILSRLTENLSSNFPQETAEVREALEHIKRRACT